MALTLNTSHPLYSDLLSFVCVSDGAIVDIKQPSATLTAAGAVTIGSGVYGAHFTTSNSGDSALGVTISSAHAYSLGEANSRTLFVVTNGHVSSGNRGYLGGNSGGLNPPGLAIGGTTGAVTVRSPLAVIGSGTTDVRVGAHSMAVARNGAAGDWRLVVDGGQEASSASSYANENQKIDLIGGGVGGRGFWSNKFVYFVWFARALTNVEISDLHASLGAGNQFALLATTSDTTPPSLTSPSATATGATTASGSVTTNEANGTLYYLASANATETDVTVKAAASQAVTQSATPQSVSFTGLTAATPYYPHYLHRDAAGNDSAVASGAQFTTSAAGDTAVPTLTGSVTFASITQTSYTANWPAGSDNVAVTGYEYQIDSGAWTDVGNNLSVAITGRTAGMTETVYVRAYDAAGLRSTPAISGSVTLESIPAAGINVTEPLKNNTGTVLASQSGVRVAVLQAADLVSVHEATGLTTNASGILATISDAAITTGQQYHVAIKLADGSVGITGPITAS